MVWPVILVLAAVWCFIVYFIPSAALLAGLAYGWWMLLIVCALHLLFALSNFMSGNARCDALILCVICVVILVALLLDIPYKWKQPDVE